MDIFSVDIYIETSVHGPRTGKAAGKWLVEFITSREVTVTRSGIIYKEKTCENELALECLRDALSILTKTCSVRVNTECAHILNTMQNHWLAQWRKKDWTNARGRPVAGRELWQQVSGLLDKHITEFSSGWHPYRNVMQEDIRKELEGRRGNV